MATRDAKDLDPAVVEPIRAFFVSYHELAGKTFRPLMLVGAAAARKLITLSPSP